MPIYEYYCPDNHRVYAFFARSSALSSRKPLCPDDPAFAMVKIVSGFSVLRPRPAADGESDDPVDPHLREAMSALEHEVSRLDEKNPDPRQMGLLLRRMAELTGQPFGPTMEELARRLEAGEDPAAVEAELGQELEQEDLFDEENQSRELPPPTGRLAGIFRHLPPRRDPHLYDLEDFLPPST